MRLSMFLLVLISCVYEFSCRPLVRQEPISQEQGLLPLVNAFDILMNNQNYKSARDVISSFMQSGKRLVVRDVMAHRLHKGDTENISAFLRSYTSSAKATALDQEIDLLLERIAISTHEQDVAKLMKELEGRIEQIKSLYSERGAIVESIVINYKAGASISPSSSVNKFYPVDNFSPTHHQKGLAREAQADFDVWRSRVQARINTGIERYASNTPDRKWPPHITAIIEKMYSDLKVFGSSLGGL